MEDDEFNFHRIVKSEKNVTQQAIKESFETLWNRKYPETPWAHNPENVKLFEQKEDEQFQNTLKGLSNKKWRRKKRNQLQSTFRDDTNWKTYNWDTGKYVYALVDSKLFTLDQTDETGMPVSEHIVKMKDIRNTIAHSTTSACDADYFDQTFKSLEDHIKALKLLQLDVTPYLEELQRIKSEEKPVSSHECFQMRTQFEKLKISQQIYEEREKKYIVLEKLNAEREKHSEKVERLQQRHLEELEKLQSEIELQKQRHSEEVERLQSEYKLQKQRHSEEVERLQSEYELQKQRHSVEHNRLQSENDAQKKSFERLQSENDLQVQRHSEEIERLKYENQFQRQRHSVEHNRLQSENDSQQQRLEKLEEIINQQKCRLQSAKLELSRKRYKPIYYGNTQIIAQIMSENELQKQTIYKEPERMQSENELQKQTIYKEPERMQSENELQKQTIYKEPERMQSELQEQTYYEELESLQSENDLQEQTYYAEIESLQPENKLQKQAYYESLQSENKLQKKAYYESLQSENELQDKAYYEQVESLQSENELQKRKIYEKLNTPRLRQGIYVSEQFF